MGKSAASRHDVNESPASHGLWRNLGSPALPALAALTLLGSLWTVGCSQSQEQSRSIELEAPRISGGSIIFNDDPEIDGFGKIAEALDRLDAPMISPSIMASIQERIAQTELDATAHIKMHIKAQKTTNPHPPRHSSSRPMQAS